VNIAMFTNTYLPHVGGVARSVSTYEEELRRRGHQVRVVAPEFEGAEPSDHVLRIPAIQGFNGSDFSVRLPQPGVIAEWLDAFRPDVVHSHHPFLLGDSALRYAGARRLPLVFTHHTLYEQYTHYVPLDSDALKRFVIQMATEYCNLCTHVIAPSESVERLLRDRGVTTPITPLPTGIDLSFFAGGDGCRARQELDIPTDALVVGHLGRLAAEKNLAFLAEAVGEFLAQRPKAVFLVVGSGDYADAMRDILSAHANSRQIVMPGARTGQPLADAYAAMDVFAFSSQSETQGMVLAEAMAAGTPVVALDGPGVRDVLTDQRGRLLPADASEKQFADALLDLTADRDRLKALGTKTRETINDFGLDCCADRLEQLYQHLNSEFGHGPEADPGPWDRLLARMEIEWKLVTEKTAALAAVVTPSAATKTRLE
jgi:glycosyltransferase involved in cell wall biosynthesis